MHVLFVCSRLLYTRWTAAGKGESGIVLRLTVTLVLSRLDQELISYRYSSSCSSSSCWGDLFNKVQGSVVSNQIGMKFGRIVLKVNTHRLTESDFWYDVIVSTWRPWRPAAFRCFHRLPASPPSALVCSSWSTVRSYVLNLYNMLEVTAIDWLIDWLLLWLAAWVDG